MKRYLKVIEIPLPPLSIQQSIVKRIEEEQELVNGNKELIRIYEGKIKEEIGKLWKKEKEVKEYGEEREIGMIAAEE
jgi:restriction endonuclease S subunit